MLGHHNVRAAVPRMVRLLQHAGAGGDILVSSWTATTSSNLICPPSGHMCGVRRSHPSGHYQQRSMMTSTASCATSSNCISREFPTREAPHVANSRRWFSQSGSGGKSKSKSKSKLLIHTQGERYGSREYMLLPSTIPVDDLDDNDPEVSALIRKYRLASLRANRNVLFGAKCFASIGGSGGEDSNSSSENLVKACTPLVKIALNDAGSNGEQPQALASLDGLCAWVKSCLANNGKGSKELERIVNKMDGGVKMQRFCSRHARPLQQASLVQDTKCWVPVPTGMASPFGRSWRRSMLKVGVCLI